MWKRNTIETIRWPVRMDPVLMKPEPELERMNYSGWFSCIKSIQLHWLAYNISFAPIAVSSDENGKILLNYSPIRAIWDERNTQKQCEFSQNIDQLSETNEKQNVGQIIYIFSCDSVTIAWKLINDFRLPAKEDSPFVDFLTISVGTIIILSMQKIIEFLSQCRNLKKAREFSFILENILIAV